MNLGSVRSARVNFCGGLILETNCIFEYKPSPHFRLDVVYKMGGVLTGHYGITMSEIEYTVRIPWPWDIAII